MARNKKRKVVTVMEEKKKGFIKKFVNEFKAFALKGNVMDLAVGVIIGAAFQDIVTSFTENFINPIIGCIGGADVEGKTNEATKNVKEPLQKGQTAPKDDKQQQRQEKPQKKNSKGMKM